MSVNPEQQAQNGAHGTPNKEKILAVMKKGTKLTKLRKKSNTYVRHFNVDKSMTYVQWIPSRKASTKNRFFMKDIKEIRTGAETDTFRNFKKNYQDELCMSLVFSGNNKTLDLVANSKDDAIMWAKGIRAIKKQLLNVDIHSKRNELVHLRFMKADKDGDGTVDFQEVCDLLTEMNIKVDKAWAKSLFELAVKNRPANYSGPEFEMSEEEFVTFYNELTKRPEIYALFKRYSFDFDDNEAYWTLEELKGFVVHEQNMPDVTDEWLDNIIQTYEPTPEAREAMLLSPDGFKLFLLGKQSMLMNPLHETVYQDMTQPLSHYFIASSHNTYLLQDQLRGPSSTEAYVRALQLGCRCVELDCWDGSDGEPVIYHGYTLTSKIKYRDVIEVINKYAFEVSDYPVILSLENHCSVEQQEKMADDMIEIFGDTMYTVPMTSHMKILPSPGELKNMIIIKGKKLHDDDEGDVSDEDEAADMDDEEVKKESSKKSKSKVKLSKKLSDLVVLCKSVHFSNFQHSQENYTFWEMSSFGESKALGLAKDEAPMQVKHNITMLSRTYPAGKRTNSSNYPPQPLWNTGCQIVALNYQTASEEMDLNNGKFKQNGNCGYILKPSYQRSDMSFDPENPGNASRCTLTIKIISGQQFPKISSEIIDPYVKVYIEGATGDCQDNKTSVVHDNGFNPNWNETMEFEIKVPELALVRFLIRDYEKLGTNEYIGQYTIPMISMQQGYHHLPLLSREGESLLPSCLFVHVQITAGASAHNI